MAIGGLQLGTAKALLVALGFVAGVLVLIWAPVGAGDDAPRVHVVSEAAPSASTRAEARMEARIEVRHSGGFLAPGQEVVEADPVPAQGDVSAYLSELTGRGNPDQLLPRGRAYCALLRRAGANESGPMIAVNTEDGVTDDQLVAAAAFRHLCPEARPAP